jgi:hypothetical protein
MAEYVYVENNQIAEYHGDLPQNWRNISGLRLLKDDLDALLNLGWYPVTKVSVACDSETQRITGYNYEIQDRYVTETPVVESIPSDQIPTFEGKKFNFLLELRGERNQRLQACDWTQLTDSVLAESVLEQWRTYRQALRDLPNVYATDNTLTMTAVQWPVSPGGIE